MKKIISIVIPIFNEQENIPHVYERVTAIMSSVQSMYNYEIIFINDGSHDASWHLLTQIAKGDEQVKALSFSRNFGHQAALTAGYDVAIGDAVITMDADLQDPPVLILEMLQAWEQGAEIVYARRINRRDSFIKRITAAWFYKFLDKVADVRIPRNVGDFRLVDKKIVLQLRQFRERARYLRGMVAWTGFKQAYVDFNRPDRFAGKTGYTWKKMFKLAVDGLTSFSMFPLKVAAYVGLIIIFSGCGMLAYIAFDTLVFNVSYPLFKWLITGIYMFMGVQFLLLWLLGEYIGRIYDQQKGRPLYIVSDTLNQDVTQKQIQPTQVVWVNNRDITHENRQ
jgi:polyisoprenyl-phosphate glycosyltransferase